MSRMSLYEEGPWVKPTAGGGRGRGPWVVAVERRSFLYRALRLMGDQVCATGAAPIEIRKGPSSGQAHLAPAGAKGWLRVSIHQIASASLRAIVIVAIAEPRRPPCHERKPFTASLCHRSGPIAPYTVLSGLVDTDPQLCRLRAAQPSCFRAAGGGSLHAPGGFRLAYCRLPAKR
jgi:hypothetical protein